GTVVKSDDVGATWDLIPNPAWSSDLHAVHGIGSVLYVAGQDGFCRRSTDGGASWTGDDLTTDTRSDVFGVHVISADTAFFTGGGGYIRKTVNGTASFTWGVHPLQTPLSSIYFHDALNGWACAALSDVVIRTTDGGATWTYPQGTTESRSWNQRLTSTSSIGNTLEVNPWNKDHIYAALGRFVYMSGDRGENWVQTANISSGSGSTHSFYISPKDTNLWVAAFTGGGDHIRRSTDRGVTWTSTIVRNFTSYGMPLERDPNNPDTLLFAADAVGSDGVLYRSFDFGATWDTLSVSSLRSPCDIVIVPDSNSIVYVGDGITGSGSGQMWRSEDYGKTFTMIYSVSGSEIPMISISRHRNSEAFATAWSSGGVMRTQNFGKTWTSVATTSSSWGTDVSKDDPNVIVYGSYGSGDSFISTDGGDSFTSVNNNGSNYGYYAYDRGTFFAQQSGGVWKLRATYTMPTSNAQALVLLSPNGGESWEVGSTEEIRWTSNNVTTVDVEYSTDGGSVWEMIAAGVTASSGMYSWVIPDNPVESALVRVSDGDDGNPLDISDASFSITVASVSVNPELVEFGEVLIGQVRMDTVRVTNTGTATLVVTSVTAGTPQFVPGRTSFTVAPGSSDTLSIWFSPVAVQSYTDTLVIVSNATGGDQQIFVRGEGTLTVDVTAGEDLVPSVYTLEQNYPNPFNPATEIRYGIPTEGMVTIRVYSMLGEEVKTLVHEVQSAGWYTTRFSAQDMASGLYLYRLEANDFVSTRKMLLLK
ncbi:MAG: choice-of-anchor D domain-containing protein, partial [Ignavibacteria bacterium]|nr:choice-of-anchor D domain-containing protein [Ignavibacteria bacterium]